MTGPSRLLVSIAATILIATAAHSDDFYRPSLHGLPGVHVLVEQPSPAAQAAGIDTTLVRNRVEVYLKEHGVPVLSRQAVTECERAPMLLVEISAGHRKGEPIIWHADVSLFQNVTTLDSSTQQPILAGTWFGLTGFGTAPPERLKATVLSAVEGQLEDFANDWLATNGSR